MPVLQSLIFVFPFVRPCKVLFLGYFCQGLIKSYFCLKQISELRNVVPTLK